MSFTFKREMITHDINNSLCVELNTFKNIRHKRKQYYSCMRCKTRYDQASMRKLCTDCTRIRKQCMNSNLKKRFAHLKFNLVDTTLTYDDFINQWDKQHGKCALTGIDMTYSVREQDTIRHITNVSISRIDLSRRYTPDNIILVCVGVNTTKYSLSIDDYITMCLLVTQYHYDA